MRKFTLIKNLCNKFIFTLLALMTMGVASAWAAWSGNGSAVKQVGSTYYVLYETGEVSLSAAGSKQYTLSGPGASLSFDAKRQVAGTLYLLVADNDDNSIWSGTLSTSYAGKSGTVNVDASKIKFTNAGTLKKYIKNVKVTMAQYVNNPSVTSLTWDAADINTTETTKDITVAWCNVPAMTYSITGTNASLFEVSVANNSEAGKYNTATFTVKYKRSTAGSHSATLTIKDSYGNYSKTVTLSGTTNKLTPSITWTPDDAMFNVDDVLSATNNNNLTVTLSGDANYVSCSGNTATMLAATSGTITITAHVTGDNIYADRDITKDITITNLEKQYITWTQDFSRLKTTDASKSIVLNATASSGLPVTYELVGDKTGLTLTQSGNTWTLTYSATECKNTTILAKQAGDGTTYAPASSVSLPVKVVDPTKVCDMNETLVNSQISLKAQSLLSPASVTYNIDIPASMTVSFSRMKTGLFDTYLLGVDVEFYSGRNGSGDLLYTKEYSASDINTSLSNSNINLSSYINAKSVKITTSATNGYYINAVSYAHQKYCTLSANTVAFETFPNTETSAKTFKVNYANYPIYLECSNPKFTFTPTEFGDCSEYGTQEISVKYTAGNDEGEDVGYLYVKDNTGVTLQTCTLTVVISKVSQSITSTNIQSSYWTTDKVTLSAEANSELTDFTYSASPAGIATIAGSEMIFSQSGTIAITVNQAGNNIYRPTSTTVSNVEVKKSTPDIATAPTGTSIVYLQTLNKSTLSGGAADITLRGVAHTPVAGSFAWTEPAHVVMDAAGEHSYEVTFTPTDGGMYTTSTCNVTITVNKAAQAISMNNGSVRVSVEGTDAGASDSYLDLNTLIASQTSDPVNNNRVGAVTYEVISAEDGASISDASINVNDKKTFSATKCGKYTIRATKAATAYYNEAMADFTVTVSKRANTLTTESVYTKYVDDVITSVATIVNSDGAIHTTSSDATIAYYNVAQNKIVIPNSSAKSFDQTTVAITISQDATDRFEACAEKTITLTIKKHDNTLSYKWNSVNRTSWSEFLKFDEGATVTFSANNSVTPIAITQKTGEKNATYYPDQNAIYASYNIGDATWEVTQEENYKYKAATPKTLTVNINTIDETCYVLKDNSEYTIGTIGTGPVLKLTGPGEYLYFEGRKTFLAASQFYVQFSTNGTEFDENNDVKVDLQSSINEYKEYGPIAIPEGTTHIRFRTETGATLVKHYKNILVTRKESFKIVDKEGKEISSLVMPMNVVSAKEGEANSSYAKFYVDYNVCADEINVVSNHNHFTVSESSFSTTENEGHGHKEIIVTYTSATFEDVTATITVYTPNDHATLTVYGRTDKQSQEIVWANDFIEEPVTLSLGYVTGSAASATSEMPVTYSVAEGEENIIEIADDGYSFTVIGEGTVHLTAAQEGSAAWYPTSSTKEIHATGKKIQVIYWIQDLTYSLQLDDNVDLLAEVHIRNMQTGAHTKDNARTALIHYSCPENNGVIEILNNKTLHVLNYGTTTITASVEGNAYYKEAAPVTLRVEMHEPSTGCPDPLMINYTGVIELFSMDIDWGFSGGVTPAIIGEEMPIDLNAGKPDKLSFMHEGEKYIAPVIKTEHYKGNIKVQQHVTEEWIDVAGSIVSPTVGTWNEISNLQLAPNADAIRFVREANGMGYHNISNIRVTMQSYLTTDEPVVDLGTLQIGTVLDATLDIEYANVKGALLATRGTEETIFTLGVSAIYPPCGSVGKYKWPIRFAPTTKGEWQNTVTITDELTGQDLVITVKANVIPGAMFIFETAGEWGDENNWNKEELPGADDYVIIAQDVTIPYDADVTVKTLAINEGVTVNVEGKLTVMESTPGLENHGNLHVLDKGYVNLSNIAVGGLKVNDFILDAALGGVTNSGLSGQVESAENLNVRGDAFFQMTLNPNGANTLGWYDFVVPFEVDVLGGISIAGDDTPLVFNDNYAVMDYSEAKRAANGKDWNKFRATMEPGRVYTIAIDADHPEWNTVLFKKKEGASIIGDRSFTTEYSSTIGEETDRGWNGFGNGTLRHAELEFNEGDNTKVQIYDRSNYCYQAHEAKNYAIAVGTSFFIQYGGVQTVELHATNNNDNFLAPARDKQVTDEFRLALTANDEEFASDHLWVSASEEATGNYVIGHDLLKMGTPTESKVAQMWTMNNNKRLCDIEMPLANNSARCDLSLFAPQEGQYSLAIEKAPEDATLYLTYNGKPIWNLSMSPYLFDLTNGTTEGYGLMMYVHRAPEVATGIDETTANGKTVRKVLIDNQMYLITPEGAIFSATGKKIQ